MGVVKKVQKVELDNQFWTDGFIEAIGGEQRITETFFKRELVLRVDEEYNGNTYSEYPVFTMLNKRTSMVDGFAAGQYVRVHWNLRGKKSVKDGKTGFFNQLDMWKIERVQQPVVQAPVQQDPLPGPYGQPAYPAGGTPGITMWQQQNIDYMNGGGGAAPVMDDLPF